MFLFLAIFKDRPRAKLQQLVFVESPSFITSFRFGCFDTDPTHLIRCFACANTKPKDIYQRLRIPFVSMHPNEPRAITPSSYGPVLCCQSRGTPTFPDLESPLVV